MQYIGPIIVGGLASVGLFLGQIYARDVHFGTRERYVRVHTFEGGDFVSQEKDIIDCKRCRKTHVLDSAPHWPYSMGDAAEYIASIGVAERVGTVNLYMSDPAVAPTSCDPIFKIKDKTWSLAYRYEFDKKDTGKLSKQEQADLVIDYMKKTYL